MSKKMLWTDVRRSIRQSRGRFLSIVGLMALGSFALVGLFVAGPDMRATGEKYFDAHHVADLVVIGDLGLNEGDCSLIGSVSDVDAVDFGYLKDAAIQGSDRSLRIQSVPGETSQYEVVDGRLPESSDEIAVDEYLEGTYALGDTISFDEKPDAQGNTVLVRDSFSIVGFVNSSEMISGVNMGASTAGSGELEGYAVVTNDAFDSDVYMTARLTFSDTAGLDPYSDEYADKVHAHREELEELLAGRPGVRLAEVRSEGQESIDEGQKEVDDGRAELDAAATELSQARDGLDDARRQVSDSERELEERTSSAAATIASGVSQLAEGQRDLVAARAELAQKEQELDAARERIAAGEESLKDAEAELEGRRAEYEEAAKARPGLVQTAGLLSQGVGALDDAIAAAGQADLGPEAASTLVSQQVSAIFPDGEPGEGDASRPVYNQLVSLEGRLAQLGEDATGDEVRAVLAEGLAAVRSTMSSSLIEVESAIDGIDSAASELATAQDEIDGRRAELDEARSAADAAERQIQDARAQADAAEGTLSEKAAELSAGSSELASSRAGAQSQIDAAKDEIATREREYQEALAEYDEELPGAEQRLEDAQSELDEARQKLARLEAPGYDVNTRREIPGGDGYKIYATVADIIDALARVFPVLLYFIAALVTFTTMTRMVDEERIGAGTLKALGYSDADVTLKFVVYGLVSSMTGTALGILAGHTLLPLIVYGAYGSEFVLPPISLLFNPGISLVAVVLGLVSAVLPAWLAAKQELRAEPAELLVPKPPAGGSKILLERIPFIWNHMDFTHKVTARNIFRYKKRMLMTIFGVAGAVVLLVAGFGTQYSISGISDEQFGSIVKYDMIVARSATASDDEVAELEGALRADDVSRSMAVRYEDVTKVAGNNADAQEITLLVPDEQGELSDFIELRDRVTGEGVELDANSCVISERLSQLLGVGVGDTFTVSDDTGGEHTLTCTGVTEMYMGHFIFMGKDAYSSAFGGSYEPNAYLVTLSDSSASNVNQRASDFMRLDAVEGIVQNTALIAQIATIVQSLNKIMVVLIVVATLLAVVILYNLTTINVSERLRELSTIKVLGFYDGEVTMYIYRETMVLTALGILVGFAMGVWFRNYIINVVPPDNVMFDPAFAPYVFVIPLVIVVAITVVLGFVVNRRLRDVDMLEALKSVE